MRLSLPLSHSLRLSLIFLFLLLTFNFLLPTCGQDWLEITPKAGAEQVDTLRPAMNQAQDQWFKSPAGDTGYKYIDDVVIDLDTTYLYTNSILQYQGWLANDFSTSNSIDSVRLVVKARSTATSGSPQLTFGRELYAGEGLWGYCTEYGGETKTVTLTPTYDSNWTQTWAVDPCDGEAWTTSKLNDDLRAWAFSSTSDMGTFADSFGSMADSATGNHGANYISGSRFQVGSGGGTLTDIRLKVDDATPSGNVKLAIYTDTTVGANNYPRTKLWADATGQAVVNGWNSVSTSAVTLTANTWYWLCDKISATNTVQFKGGVNGYNRWRAHTYATAWPDTIATSGWSGNQWINRYIGVYSVTAQDRVTQTFIVVYSHAVGGEKNK